MKANWNAGEVGDSCTVTITDEAFGDKEFGVQEACDILTAEIASISSKDAKRIAALVALNEQKDAEIARLREDLRNCVKARDMAAAAAKRRGSLPKQAAERAAAYERGARDALRWEQLSVRGGNPAHKSAADVAGDTVLARFLASRGTTENKGEEE